MFALPIGLYQFFFLPLGFIGLYRWIQLLIKMFMAAGYLPIEPLEEPTYESHRDVTIVVPTIDTGDVFLRALNSWLACKPYEILIVTVESCRREMEDLIAKSNGGVKIVRILIIDKPNKRAQLVMGVKECKTSILALCDDDVVWPETMLDWCLAPFENPRMGGVGSSQWAIPVGKKMTIWEIIACQRLSMRNLEITASTWIDGGVSCLSGRTALYRTDILRDPSFQHEFLNEYWMGKYHQKSGDDKFLTRWLQKHKWLTWIQVCKEAELLTTFKPDSGFITQLLRWTRNTWRSDFRALFVERQIWLSHPYTAFTMFDRMFNPLTGIYGMVLVLSGIINYQERHTTIVPSLISYFTWVLATRGIKYMVHYTRRVEDIMYLPVFILYSACFVFLKIYCLFTLHIVAWGTRNLADDANKPPIEEKIREENRKVTVSSVAIAPTVLGSPSKPSSRRNRPASPSKKREAAATVASPSRLKNRKSSSSISAVV